MDSPRAGRIEVRPSPDDAQPATFSFVICASGEYFPGTVIARVISPLDIGRAFLGVRRPDTQRQEDDEKLTSRERTSHLTAYRLLPTAYRLPHTSS